MDAQVPNAIRAGERAIAILQEQIAALSSSSQSWKSDESFVGAARAALHHYEHVLGSLAPDTGRIDEWSEETQPSRTVETRRSVDAQDVLDWDALLAY